VLDEKGGGGERPAPCDRLAREKVKKKEKRVNAGKSPHSILGLVIGRKKKNRLFSRKNIDDT